MGSHYPARLRLSATTTKENDVTRRDRFIWKADDIEVHRVTARAIAYDNARIPLREVGVTDADPRQATHRAIDELYRETESWRTVEITLIR
jgi:hypothetical protein